MRGQVIRVTIGDPTRRTAPRNRHPRLHQCRQIGRRSMRGQGRSAPGHGLKAIAELYAVSPAGPAWLSSGACIADKHQLGADVELPK